MQNTKTIPMQHHEENPWHINQSQEVYHNNWIQVIHHDVTHQSGKQGIYGVVHFKHYALGVVVFDETDRICLVGQYRFPLNEYTWEIPEGGGKLNIDPLVSIQRELKEETGITATDWKLIQQLQLSNSATDEIAFLYTAKMVEQSAALPDQDESIVHKMIPFEEAYQMVLDGKITDSLSVAAILKVKLMRLEKTL